MAPLNEIQLHFDKCSLVVSHGIVEYPYFDTQIGLYVKDSSGVLFRDLLPIGTYRLITLLNGEVDDDYLVIDVENPGA